VDERESELSGSGFPDLGATAGDDQQPVLPPFARSCRETQQELSATGQRRRFTAGIGDLA
jgi:hypothetical protein